MGLVGDHGPNVRAVLVYGPLPPPLGGARVSFKLIYDYLQSRDNLDVGLCNVPVRKSIATRVDHVRTVLHLLRSLPQLVRADQALIAGSRNFCAGYGAILALLALLARTPTSLRFFGGRPFQAYDDAPRLIRLFLLAALRLHKKISVQTHAGKHEFPEALHSRIDVHHGHRPTVTKTAAIQPANAPGDPIRFVYTGELSKAKGTDLLLEATNRLLRSGEELELHLFGAEVDVEIATSEAVVHHGVCRNEELRNRLGDYDAFVFPTAATTEGHPGSLIEAILAGLPIISSDLETIREIIDNGESGILVPIGDADQLVDAMRAMMEPEVRSKLSAGSRERSDAFDADNVLPEMILDLGLA